MKVMGIIGSPRRENGRSHQVVSRVLEGARAVGAETDVLYLVDEQPEYCIHCGHPCFEQGDCIQEEQATARSRLVEAADALVICVPVYVWQVNGLTAAFLDKVRLSTGAWVRDPQHGRPALGIAVAGGTGTGVFPALQSLYAWLCLWKFRPLDPLPVTRFNLDRVLENAASLGRELASYSRQPFDGVGDLLLTYDNLPYMNYTRIDEFRWLAEQVAMGLERRGGYEVQVAEVRRLLEESRTCAARAAQVAQANSIVQAYRTGASSW